MMHVPEIVCWVLLHFLWQATVVAILYTIADSCIPSLSVRSRYVLALITLILMFASAGATVVYETFRIGQHVFGDGDVLAYGRALIVAQVFRPGMFSPNLMGARTPLWVDALWSAGVLIMSIRALGGLWFLSRFRRMPCLGLPETLVEQLSDLKSRLRITRDVTLRVNCAVSSPFVAGTLRPVIYLPVYFLSGLTPEQIEMVLVHELAHIVRADYFWNIFQVAMETLFFFHPAVWWIGRALREQREHCCDDAVLESLGDRTVYANALLMLAENGPGTSQFAIGLRGNGGSMQLLPRLARILGLPLSEANRSQSNAVLKLSMPAIVGVALLSCSLAAPIGRMTLPSTVEAFSEKDVSAETTKIDASVIRRAQREANALASKSASLALQASAGRAAEGAGETESLAPELAAQQATRETRQQAVANRALHYARNMSSSPLVIQTDPSTLTANGISLDTQALAEQAIPAAVEEQLRLHPELRLDHKRIAPLDRDVGQSLIVKPSRISAPATTDY